MKPSAILRGAAKLIEDGECSEGCWAITSVGQRLGAKVSDIDKAHGAFDAVKPPSFNGGYDTWWGSVYDNPRTNSLPRNMNARIVGLCLAAAIAESEGK